MAEDDIYKAVLAELSNLVDAWRIHREVINRAISLLNQEVIGFQKRLDSDDKDRAIRQEHVDAQLQRIQDGQANIRRWQIIRIVIEVVAIVIVVAFIIGRSV